MNYKILLVISFIVGFSNQNKAQKNDGFKLLGQFKGLGDGVKAYLTTQEKDTIAETISKGDKVVFYGKLPLNGKFHFIKLDTSVSKVGSKAIFLINDIVNVFGEVGSRNVIVKGSPPHNEYQDLIYEIGKFKKKQSDVRDSISFHRSAAKGGNLLGKDTVDKQMIRLYNELDTLIKKQHIAVIKWIQSHTASLYAPYVITGSSNSLGHEGMQNAYNNLTPEVKKSYYGLELKKQIETIKVAVKIRTGKILPDFNVSSIDHKSFSVLEYAKKGKITLIDFWASWCHPCRAEIPNMKKVYDAFHDKGFNILGISTDAKEADWRKALLEDGTPWFHGLDNLEKATKGIFGISAIPAFALVDGDGKLIAFECGMSKIESFGPEIRGEGLYKTIEDLLKEKTK